MSDQTYHSGEIPMIGDRVEVYSDTGSGQPPHFKQGDRFTVTGIMAIGKDDRPCVQLDHRHNCLWLLNRFVLVMRKPDVTALDTAGVFH